MTAVLRRLRLLAVPAAWLLALGCAAAVAAAMFWRFAAPHKLQMPLRIDTDPRAVAQRIVGQHPFAGEAPAARPVQVAAAAARYALVGLATGFAGGPGFALLKSGGGDPQAFVEGEEIASGVRLKAILADAVELERDGRVERLSMPAVPTTGIVPAQHRAASAPPGTDVQPSKAANTR